MADVGSSTALRSGKNVNKKIMRKKNLFILFILILVGCNISKVKTNKYYYSKGPIKDIFTWNGYLYFMNDSIFERTVSYSTSVCVTYGNYSIANDTIILISNPKLKDNRNPLFYYQDSLYAKIFNQNLQKGT